MNDKLDSVSKNHIIHSSIFTTNYALCNQIRKYNIQRYPFYQEKEKASPTKSFEPFYDFCLR